MRLRYRYRLDLTPPQRRALARAFGCARVVYNDGLRLPQDAHKAGLPFIGDTELQHRVLTLAKRTPERAWLGDVSAVILQQSLADLGRAYRNWFADLRRVKVARTRGEQAKLKVRKPRFKSRIHNQAVRFTRNSRFRVLPDGHLSLPKVSKVRMRWSRPLPAAPSLPPADTAVGVDLGLSNFAALSTGEKVDNPRWLRQREQALRRSQRNMARKRKGSRNREKARRKVGRLDVRVADARRDFHHQLSTRLLREYRTVCVETLNVAGLGRSKLAKSVNDASACGRRDGPKALTVRAWTCSGCGSLHDQDLNAARNILAAGLAVAACGGHVRPGAIPAAVEAGTTLAGAA